MARLIQPYLGHSEDSASTIRHERELFVRTALSITARISALLGASHTCRSRIPAARDWPKCDRRGMTRAVGCSMRSLILFRPTSYPLASLLNPFGALHTS